MAVVVGQESCIDQYLVLDCVIRLFDRAERLVETFAFLGLFFELFFQPVNFVFVASSVLFNSQSSVNLVLGKQGLFAHLDSTLSLLQLGSFFLNQPVFILENRGIDFKPFTQQSLKRASID